MPKRVKYRKLQRGTKRGVATTGCDLAFGEFGLKSLENGWLKNTQIEAVRVILARQLHRGGKLWIRVFPDKPITTKGSEVGMGGGKGKVDHYVVPMKPGRIIFELTGIKEEIAREAFRVAADKLPIKTKFVKR